MVYSCIIGHLDSLCTMYFDSIKNLIKLFSQNPTLLVSTLNASYVTVQLLRVSWCCCEHAQIKELF